MNEKGKEIVISPMTRDDLREVLKIERESFRHPFTFELFESEMGQRAAKVFVARREGEILGYIDYWLIVDEIHLINLVVSAHVRRQRIATSLFEFMIRSSPNHRLVYLEVRPSNKEARSFYEKQGFGTIGLRKNYYPDGEDALVMKKGEKTLNFYHVFSF